MPLENLKDRIRQGKLTLGVSVPWDSTKEDIQRICSQYKDYNFISIDSQHNPLDESKIASISHDAATLGIPVHFRIKHTNYTWQIGNWLDLGPAMIEVPQTEKVSTAQEAIDYFYYSPAGKRSWGGTSRIEINDRPDRLEYASWWNNFGVLWLQVESLPAISNIPKLALSGIDCISWGPADLSFDRESNPHHPLSISDQACIDHAFKLLENSHAQLVLRNYNWRERDKFIDMGAKVILERPK